MTTEQPPSHPQPPADDDQHVTRWLDEIGPLREMPPETEVGRPVVAAVALLAGGAGLTVALFWVAFGFAVHLGIWTPAVLALLIVGTLLVLTGIVFACLARRQQR